MPSDVNPSFTITDIKGIEVGHSENHDGVTGCTVVRFPRQGVPMAYEARGGAPGTRETDLFSPTKLIQRVHAISLSGGSSFGLDSACGVMTRLEEEKIGFRPAPGIVIPIVPGAIIYDLEMGSSKVRPNASMGYEACKNASTDPVQQGNVGAGLGATVGKIRGAKMAMKGGLGSYSKHLDHGLIFGAIVVVNAVGDIVDDETGKIIAGTRSDEAGVFANSEKIITSLNYKPAFLHKNTTIGLIACNASYEKAELQKIAEMAHNGLARVVRPSHTMFDGDTLFVASAPNRRVNVKPDLTAAGCIAAEVLAKAIVSGIVHAKSLAGIPSASDYKDRGSLE
jgi:L-aminopeptidase/D-esterase-like protein